jgi:hypothetical protein
MLCAGCLLGYDPREDAGELGDPCEEDFDCQRGLVCKWDYVDGFEFNYCNTDCDDDDDCDEGYECSYDGCELEGTL